MAGRSGAPVLASAAASVECSLSGTLEEGDHAIFLGEVIDAGLNREIPGRPDDENLTLGDLGDSTFYDGLIAPRLAPT